MARGLSQRHHEHLGICRRDARGIICFEDLQAVRLADLDAARQLALSLASCAKAALVGEHREEAVLPFLG